MKPEPNTPQHRAYLAGRETALRGRPCEHPYMRLVSPRTHFLASWWNAGWNDGRKDLHRIELEHDDE